MSTWKRSGEMTDKTWAATFVGLRYIAGLVFVADMRGEVARFEDGMRIAAERSPALGLWALISVVVGWLLLASILSAAWSLITFFVLPVIVRPLPVRLERHGGGPLRRSRSGLGHRPQ